MEALHMFSPLATGSELFLTKEANVGSQPEMHCVLVPLQLGSYNQPTTNITRRVSHCGHGAGY